MDRAGKAAAIVPVAAAAIVGTGVGTCVGGSGGVLLGTGGRVGFISVTREELLVSSSIMMDITCHSPDFVLIDFLNFFRQLPFSALSGSLLCFFMLIFRYFLMDDLPSFFPYQDFGLSFCSQEISINSCRVCQRRSTPVLPCPANGSAETLAGFGFVGLDF